MNAADREILLRYRIQELESDRDTAIAEAGALRAEVAALKASANPITDSLREKWPDFKGTDADLLRRLLVAVSGRRTGRSRWSNVSELTTHGSGYSGQICSAIGVDPGEVMPRLGRDDTDEVTP